MAVLTAQGTALFIDGSRCEAFDRAPTKDQWYTPWGGPPEVRSWSVARDTGALYVNVHVGGILRSTDGGQSWDPTLDLDHDVHEVVAIGGGVVLAACGDGGLAVSGDGGSTWRFVVEGLRATYCRAVAVSDDGSTVLLSASRGPGGQESAVYRRPLDAADDVPFELVAEFDGNVDRIPDDLRSG